MNMQSIFQNRRRPRKPNRRGVLLLVCLSLLVLFAVIGVTFVMVSGQYRRAARSEVRTERYADDPGSNTRPGELLDEAFMQLARGTTNTGSSLQFHDLLGDMYGHEVLQGQVENVVVPLPAGSGQVLEFSVQSATNMSPFAGYYNGCLLTVLNGRAAGKTARIVGYNPSASATSSRFRVLAFEGGVAPEIGDGLIVNARPFTGTGFGYDATTGRLTQMDGHNEHPLTLVPHFKYAGGSPDIGGAHEDYDAPDVQNMALAYIPTSGAMIPSFHRPDLVKFWLAGDDWATFTNPDTTINPDYEEHRELARHIILRPLQLDHPNFTGSNPAFDPTATTNPNPWDIDNDGDGAPDSIWLDLGFPAQTSADGRQFKPLFAFLCVDLDGRLNVNAHGSLAEVYYVDDGTGSMVRETEKVATAYFAGRSSPWQVPLMPRGQGYGPAEITLKDLWDPSDSSRWQRYSQLFAGNANWEGRYGERASLGSAPLGYDSTAPFVGPHPGRSSQGNVANDDMLSAIAQFGFYGIPNKFSSPPDMWGRRWLGLDLRGAPMWASYNANLEAMEILDDPYEIDLSHKVVRNARDYNTTTDNPFSAYELEAILRPYDIDSATLPQRLRDLLATNQPTAGAQRHLATTDSFDAPVASMKLPQNIDPTDFQTATGMPTSQATIIDLYRYRLASISDPVLMNAQLRLMLPFDLVGGLKMDVNRAFGNGLDDNNNGAVDEPGETDSSGNPTVMWGNANVPFLPVWDSATEPNNDYATRQAYARHLYVLAMFLKGLSSVGDDREIDFDGDPANNTPEETAYGLAQWAINVVDFRDRDAIMTPFEFDINPFDGWDVDGDISATSADNGAAHRGLVWGCERPELLITETLAWHDRRTEDLQTPNGKTNDMPDGETDAAGGTNDFDQRLRPRGAFFMELYNPWSMNELPPGELYRDNANNITSGVALDRITDPSNPAAASPVWRVAVVKGDGRVKDPDHFDPSERPVAADFDRAIYFADPVNVTDITDKYHTDLPVPPVLPGHYAVVGSSGATEAQTGQEYVTPIGRNTTLDTAEGQYANTRKIVLTAATNASPVNPATSNAQVLNNNNGEPTAANIKHPVGIPINLPRSLTLTEPYNNGYPDGAGWNPAGAGGQGEYSPPLDEPLDQQAAVQPDADLRAILAQNATQLGFRVVHLQRLANPLLPWNADSNPYLTIDTMSVDLTTFNSEDPEDPNGADPQAGGTTSEGIATLERGDPDDGNVVDPQRNIWRRQPLTRTQAVTSGPDIDHNYGFVLDHSLGYLNKSYGPAYTSSDPPAAAPTNDLRFVGDPQNPFPWLTWNNRPYVGAYELMLVPPHRSSQLSRRMFLPTPNANEEYNPANPPLYGHLLNFYAGDSSGGGPALYRLFDYLRVPSPFVGTETWLNPVTFSQTAAGDIPGTEGLHPPFNKVSKYRDPGKININTIGDQRVWDAILNTHSGVQGLPNFADIQASRNGVGSPSVLFANPFRSSTGAQYQLPGANSVPATPTTLISPALTEVDVSLQRLNPNASPPRPLLRSNVDSTADSTQAYRDTNRNPYFRYEELNRISNLVTTRSNVYAVWVTVGYFEVEPVAVDEAHPDGFALGQELGADTGEITRHRGFYIFDRTLPVGYLPGQDLNVEKAILLKRFIE